MAEYRITKYDPAKREPDGRYLLDEWTMATDVGCSFGGKTLTLEAYLAVEDAYVAAVRQMMEKAGVAELRIDELQD